MSIWLLIIAAVSAFMIGGIWYGPLFGKAWAAENGFPEGYSAGPPARVFGISFLFTFVTAGGYLHMIGFSDDVLATALNGAAAGAMLVAASFGVNYQFSGKSFKLLLIDGGYHTIQFAVIGAIFAALHEVF